MEEDTECTCCCIACIEGKHCYGTINDHGWCLIPDPDEEENYWDELSGMEEEDEEALMGWIDEMVASGQHQADSQEKELR